MVIDRGYKNNFFEKSSEHVRNRFWSCYAVITQFTAAGADEMFVMEVIYLNGG